MIYKTLHIHKKTKDRATGFPLKTGRELACSGKEYRIIVYLGRTRYSGEVQRILVYLGRTWVLREGIEDSSWLRENMGTPERYRGFQFVQGDQGYSGKVQRILVCLGRTWVLQKGIEDSSLFRVRFRQVSLQYQFKYTKLYFVAFTGKYVI